MVRELQDFAGEGGARFCCLFRIQRAGIAINIRTGAGPGEITAVPEIIDQDPGSAAE